MAKEAKAAAEPTVDQFRKMVKVIGDSLYERVRRYLAHTVNQGQVVPEVEWHAPSEVCRSCQLRFREHPPIWGKDVFYGCDGRAHLQKEESGGEKA